MRKKRWRVRMLGCKCEVGDYFGGSRFVVKIGDNVSLCPLRACQGRETLERI